MLNNSKLTMNGSRSALLATLVLLASLALAPSAFAGNVNLWVCHGPGGSALGSPLSLSDVGSDTTGDGTIGTYGDGCSAGPSDPNGGGLQATFTTPAPAGGSLANLQFDVPENVTLESVDLVRNTFGFAGSPITGDHLTYSASTPSGVLESTSVDGYDGDVALSGDSGTLSAAGQNVEVGVACTLPGPCPEPAAGPVGVDISAVTLTVNDTDAPKGAVAGVQSPVAGFENMEIVASDDGLGLESASARWDSGPVTTVPLGGASCAPLSSSTSPIDLPLDADCPATVSGVPLSLSTIGLADGTHQLTVTVTDAAGNTTTLVNQPIQVLNNPPTSSPTATLSIGSGSSTGSSTSSTSSTSSSTIAPATGAGQSVCNSPQLSARLRGKPKHIKHGVPVLIKGKVYLFSGTLTCLVDGRSKAAPVNTTIEIRALTGKLTTIQTGLALNSKGAFSLLLSFKKSQTLEFIDANVGGSTVTDRIRLTVVK